MARRRHARENPELITWLVIGGGVALLGGAAYFLLRPTAPTVASGAPVVNAKNVASSLSLIGA